jgi:hypothetical protein
MDVSRKLSKEWLYTQESTDGGTSGSPDNRFDSFGSIGVAAATVSTTTAANYGVLYMEFDLEFKEFCPISATRPSLLRALQDKISHHLSRHSSGFIKGDEKGPPETLDSVDDLCDKVNVLPPTSKRPTKPRGIDITQFVNLFSALRSQGISGANAVKSISSEYILGPECIELIFKSGLMDYLKYPSEPDGSSLQDDDACEQKGRGGI